MTPSRSWIGLRDTAVVTNSPAWATETVEVRPPDPAWQDNGEREREALQASLAPWLVAPVEHVGSTAVPGLAAKPILDFQAAVADLGAVALIAEKLALVGWYYVPPELDQRPWRRFFVKVSGGRRAAHLHIMAAGTPRWDEQLAFRDALRADPGLVKAYAAQKLELAARHATDRERYTSAKADFVRAVLDGRGLRNTFDSAAELYQEARPEYPEALYDALIATAGLSAGDRILEVGCATGKATLPLARRGFRMTCIELGPALASTARRNLAAFPQVEVVASAFETWEPPAVEPFALVFAATAWHWLDPAIRVRRAWELLRPGGHLAYWSATHIFPQGGDPFFAELQEVYEQIGEGLPEGATYPQPGELPDDREEIERSGLFNNVVVLHFDWEVVYDAEGYLRLLDTSSGHIAMKPCQRDHLYSEIRRRLGERADGRLRRGWGAVLHIARRVDAPTAP